MKLVLEEAESAALEHEIGEDDRLATSEQAATVPPPALRTLDAIHLATALLLNPELDAFVVYGRHLAEAAAALGLPVSSPGAAT